MSVSLIQKLEAIKLTKFEWSSFERHVTSPDEKTGKKSSYLEFMLVNPIERVKSSHVLYDVESNQRVNEQKEDVTTIKCMVDLIGANEADFTFSETADGKIDPATCVGKYEGDLFLDVSKAGDVWLTDVRFAKFAADQRAIGKKERLKRLLASS